MKRGTLRLETILDVAQKLEIMGGPSDLFSPLSMAGLKLFEAPVQVEPKLQLSEDVIVSDEFRAKTNAWLLEMFGTREICPIEFGTAYMFGNSVIMRPESIVALRNVCA